MKKDRVRYYENENDDFYGSSGYKLKSGYKWIRTGFFYRAFSAAVYSLALLFSVFCCRLFLHVRIVGAKKLRREKRGFFLYGNHTQPVGDVFTPALCCFPKRIYTVVGADNLGIPVIGKLLPALGALPVAHTLSGTREFERAVRYRIERKRPVVIYPEAHVWEYYSGIRPFSDAAFRLPAKLGTPVYSFTVTYKKRGKSGKRRPAAIVYADGPFAAPGDGIRERAKSLRDGVYAAKRSNSEKSDCEYIKYVKKGEAEK